MFFKKNKESENYFKEYQKILDYNIDLITDSLNKQTKLKISKKTDMIKVFLYVK